MPLLTGAKAKNIKPEKLENFESVTGKGVQAIYKKQKVGLGNHRLLEDFGATLNGEVQKEATRMAINRANCNVSWFQEIRLKE